MTSRDIFDIADGCVERGFFPSLAGQKFVLSMEIQGSGRAIIHRNEVSFRLFCPCRVWLMSGRICELLGDSHALPGDLDCGVRPPYTG
ncbi:hypothetical protein LCGC14_1103390 [marine sediment metagenome]|uniref:Uncharacterized protein n=1 Tax=marine sediment metagenome TaxID=412755 RepID=A0A0F9MWR9_9ZZZZ